MNVALAAEHMAVMRGTWDFERLAELLERKRTTPNPAAPKLPCLDYVMLLDALEKLRPALAVPLVSWDRKIQGFYTAMRMDGASHVLAEMLALQMPPMSNTDREFLEGRGGCYDQFGDDRIGDYYAAKAKAAGVDITGAVYMPGLALEPGDVKAWVRGRGDVERVARERGMSVEGAVTVKAQDLGPPPADVTVADDLVDSRMQELIEADPGLAERDQGELRHEVREAIKPHWGE